MDADELLRRIGCAYPSRTPRRDLAAVEALRDAAEVAVPRRTFVVVGTNGKTSTSIYLGRLLAAHGVRPGVTISPHLRRWGERVQIDGEPVGDEELAAEIQALHELAQARPGREQLRFFDLVTLAAARLFARARVEAAVFEAGIGGRLDATSVLRPPVVLLTSIGLDHTELLGDTEEAILREKLAVAPPGARILSLPLPPRLRELAPGVEIVEAEGDWRERAAGLAAAALGARPDVDLAVPGRLERHTVDGVDVRLDAAHNPQAWEALADELDEPFVAVVSIGADRPPQALAPALRRAVAVFATTAWAGRSLPARELAAALRAEAVDDPVTATRLALERARATGLPLVVFGSIYLLTHAYTALGL